MTKKRKRETSTLHCNTSFTASPSSASAPTGRQWKHSVFLSFSGEDVRDNFISHLYKALSKVSRDVFIDYKLKPAEEIAPALLKAIEDSRIAVIVFSKSYASSTWCLDELEKIIKCNEIHRQKVIPVFYNVDSSHVHNPMDGIYAADFVSHEKRFKERLEQVQRWKNAMVKAANFTGWDSKKIRPDAVLVDKIVKDVLKILIKALPSNLEGLVRIDSRIKQIKELLSLDSDDVRLLGIWGMGGIGKTTIATALFKQICSVFDASFILENIRQESEKPGGLSRLREKLLFRLLSGDMVPNIEHSSVLQDILSHRKVLIVLDDLTELKQLKTLLGHNCQFGPGSRIIITSRDKEMIGKEGILGNSHVISPPYEVKKLTYGDSFKLFSDNAFVQKHPPDDFWELSDLFVKYADGIPLALEVLGRHLLGREKESWKISLSNLGKGPNQGIQGVLKLSYDDLSQDGKNMFLHVACFLSGEDIDVVKQLFECCDFSVDISYLINKCLLTATPSDNMIRMHPLLQEMGREIERQNPQRTRLWNDKDICKVFKRKKEWESIEYISLDMSKTREVLQLDSQAFERIPNLKFLKFFTSKMGVDFEKDYKVHLPEGLEYLPEELLYLYWHGYPLKSLPASFNPTNLVVLKLPHSSVEELSQGPKEFENLKEISLECSTKLRKVPSLITCGRQLTRLSLRLCTSITSIPSFIDLKFLKELDLGGCSRLAQFPEVPRSIECLFLDQTGIKEVPSSIGDLDNLLHLGLGLCPHLREISFNIFRSGIAILLDLKAGVKNCPYGPQSISSMPMDFLPDNPNGSISALDLRGTHFVNLPSLKKLCGLRYLFLNECPSLQSLPELPPTLQRLEAPECKALETITGLTNLFDLEDLDLPLPSSLVLLFSDCFKLDENAWSNLAPGIIRRIKHMAMKAKDYPSIAEPYFRLFYPGSEIPERFTPSNEGTSSITIELPPNWQISHFLGFVLCAVIEPSFDGSELHCKCHFQNNYGEDNEFMCCFSELPPIYTVSMHVLLWYDHNLYVEIVKRRDLFREGCNYKITFEFFCGHEKKSNEGIMHCGILTLFNHDEEINRLQTPLKEAFEYTKSPPEYCQYHQPDRWKDV